MINNLRKVRTLILTVLCLIASNPPALAQSEDYSPLSEAETSKLFKLEYRGRLDLDHLIDRVPIGPSGASIQVTGDQDLVFAGQDKRQRRWTFEIAGKGVPGFHYDLYTADLDHNGYMDAVLIFPTGGNGLAPTTHIITLMFDSLGRPVSFQADGYFDNDEAGISGLVDMDGDGRAELIYMNFDNGYWITHLYKARNARWERIKGRFGMHTYPLFTRFTFHPNHKPVTPRPGRHPYGPDLSDMSPKLHGRLLSYQWPDGGPSSDPTLMVETAQGKKITCKLAYWYSSAAVLVDDENGRRIVSLGALTDAFDSLLKEIVAKNYTVTLYGQRRANQCSPELLWAQPRP
jgi:hypothetical protein